MPQYSFRVDRGDQPHTTNTSDCPNDDAAKNEACGMFADMARDISAELQLSPTWQIEVADDTIADDTIADDTGKLIFRIKITAESL